MTEETAKKVSELYKKQSDLADSNKILLSKHLDINVNWCNIESTYSHQLYLPESILNILQQFLIKEIEVEMNKGKIELLEINCA